MGVTPNFQLKDSQMYNYATSKISLKTIAKNLSLSYKDSSSNNDWVMLQGEKRDIKIMPKPMKAGIMPNIVGMKLQDALWICENNGLMVKSVGRGKVMSQSIVEGQKIIRGQQIQIQLN